MAAVTAVLTLTGCAHYYTPYAGSDATRLRIKLQGRLITAVLFVTMGHVTAEGACGPTTLLPRMYPCLGPAQVPLPGPTVMPIPQFPREDMNGSTGPLHSDSVELRLAPGHYRFALMGTLGSRR